MISSDIMSSYVMISSDIRSSENRLTEINVQIRPEKVCLERDATLIAFKKICNSYSLNEDLGPCH